MAATKQTVFRGDLKLNQTLGSGTGDPVLTVDEMSKEVGQIPAIDLSAYVSNSLTSGRIFVGNSSNVATGVQASGAISISNTGVVSLSNNIVVNANIHSAAAIAYSKLNLSGAILNADIATAAQITRTKLANGTANRLIVNDGSGVISELAAITASRIIVSDASGLPIAANTATYPSLTELSRVKGVTSAIQTQFSNKLSFSSAITPAEGDLITFTGGSWANLGVGTNGQVLTSNGTNPTWSAGVSNGLPTGGTADQYLTKINGTDYNTQWTTLTLSKVTDVTASAAEVNLLDGVTASTTEINYLVGVSSLLQTQLNSKQSSSLAHNAIWVGNASNVAAQLATGTNGQVLTLVGSSPQWQTITGTGTVTSVDVSGGTTGLTTSGGPISTSGTITLTGTLIAANGGTGLASYDVGDILYADTTTTLAKLVVGSDGQILTLASGVPSWATGGSGHTIETAGTPVTNRSKLNFQADFVITDNAGDDGTEVEVAAFTGDVTKAEGGTALTIANDAVTFAKFQNITDARLLGRSAGSSGDMMEITVSSPLTLAAGALGIQVATGAQNGYLSSTDWTAFDAKWSKPSFTTGSVLFWGAADVAEDNDKFFFDDTNEILYIGENTGAFTNSITHFGTDVNSYGQVNVHNHNAGTSASGDYIATADTGTDTTNYVDVGINSSTYSDAAYTIGGALSSYLYCNGGTLTIGTQSAQALIFHTGGTLATNERMRITEVGNSIFTPTVTSGTGATAGMRILANSLTSGNGLDISSSSLSSGNLVSIASTSTAATGSTHTTLKVLQSGNNDTSGQTTYGIDISNTKTGTSSTNVGLRAVASGGSTNNGAIITSGTAVATFGNASGDATLNLSSSYTLGHVVTDSTNVGKIKGGRGIQFTSWVSGYGFQFTHNSNITGGTNIVETISSISSTPGIVNAFRANNSATTPSGTLTYTGFNATPTFNISSASASTVTGFRWSPTRTSLTNTTEYAFISDGGLSGFGTLTPTARLQAKGVGTTTGELFRLGDSADTLRVLVLDNGNVGIGGASSFGTSAVGVFAIKNGTAPTSSPADMIQLYAEDVAASSELKVRDEAGNVTTLSPHNFSLIGRPSEEMAWAYYSERGSRRINVDMLNLARLVEKLSGEKLVYIE